MGTNSKSGTVSGSYGNWAIIETPPNKITKVSCQMCCHYDVNDHSCAPGFLGPKDSIRRWEKCKDFILDPDYKWTDVIKRIKLVKGSSFVKEMLKKCEEREVDPTEYYQKKKVVNPEQRIKIVKESTVYTQQDDKDETTPLTKLEGVIYEYTRKNGTKRRCIIVSQDSKYCCLKFEDGKEVKFDRKTLDKSHRLKKL